MRINIKNSNFHILLLILSDYGYFVDRISCKYGIGDINNNAVYIMDSANTETIISGSTTFMINNLSGNTPVSLSRLVKALKKQTV